MPDGLAAFVQAIAEFMTWKAWLTMLWATLLGVIVGALPGLTATMGVALMTTLTFKLAPSDAILVLICTYVGAIYGGSRSAILLNIPGTPASAASCLDGYALARQGLAGRAMGIATSGSILGTWIGMVALAIFTPLLGEVALLFHSYEFFWLAVFGIVISGNLTGGDPLKGWIAGFAGVLVSAVGLEGVHAYPRFAYGNTDLAGGFSLIPLLVGAFGFAEVLTVLSGPRLRVVLNRFDSVIPRVRDVLRHWKTIIRSGLIGTFIGVVPGVGEDVAAWSSYAAAKRFSREREQFGQGSIDGLMAAETGDNACVPGAIIPVLTLQVPGSAPAAVLLAAMLIHGIRPGPLIMIESPRFVYEVVAMIFLASVGILLYGLALTHLLIKVLLVPRELIMPIVFVLCLVGSFAIASRVFDVGVMVAFGLIGFAMRVLDFPVAPMILGVVLGDLLDKNLRRGLVLSEGDVGAFFTRPISIVLWCLIAAILLSRVPAVARGLGWLWRRLAPAPP